MDTEYWMCATLSASNLGPWFYEINFPVHEDNLGYGKKEVMM